MNWTNKMVNKSNENLELETARAVNDVNAQRTMPRSNSFQRRS